MGPASSLKADMTPRPKSVDNAALRSPLFLRATGERILLLAQAGRIGAPGENPIDAPVNVTGNILDPCLPGYTETGTPYNLSSQEISHLHAAELGRVLINPLGLISTLNIRYSPLSGLHAFRPACPLRAREADIQTFSGQRENYRHLGSDHRRQRGVSDRHGRASGASQGFHLGVELS